MLRPQTDVYFFHIPKTAGTSLAGMIRRAYDPEDSIPAFFWHELVAMDRAELNRYRCYTGHFGTSLYSLLDRNVPSITLLRDPFERSISQIKFTQKIQNIEERQNLSPFQFLKLSETVDKRRLDQSRNPLRSFVNLNIREYQTRYLGIDIDLTRPIPEGLTPKPGPGAPPPGPLDYEILLNAEEASTTMEATYQRAKQRLDSMVVVGTVERMAESTQLIFDYLGVPMAEELQQENVSTGHSAGERYRKSHNIFLNQWVDSMTKYDRMLYDYANQLLDRRLEQRRAKLGQNNRK